MSYRYNSLCPICSEKVNRFYLVKQGGRVLYSDSNYSNVLWWCLDNYTTDSAVMFIEYVSKCSVCYLERVILSYPFVKDQ